jgi:hypothetical protein
MSRELAGVLRAADVDAVSQMWLWAALYFFVLPIALTLLFAILFAVLPETTAAAVAGAPGWRSSSSRYRCTRIALYYRTCQGRIAEAKRYRVERRRQLERLWNNGRHE